MRIERSNNSKRIGKHRTLLLISYRVDFHFFFFNIFSEMFALQNIVQQQGQHPQIFLPPRAPHLMQKVCFFIKNQNTEPFDYSFRLIL